MYTTYASINAMRKSSSSRCKIIILCFAVCIIHFGLNSKKILDGGGGKKYNQYGHCMNIQVIDTIRNFVGFVFDQFSRIIVFIFLFASRFNQQSWLRIFYKLFEMIVCRRE